MEILFDSTEFGFFTDLVVASAGDDKKISLWRKNGPSMGTIHVEIIFYFGVCRQFLKEHLTMNGVFLVYREVGKRMGVAARRERGGRRR